MLPCYGHSLRPYRPDHPRWLPSVQKLPLSLSLSVSLLTYFSKVKCAVITWKTLVISFLLNWTPQTQILSLKHTQLYTLSETPIHTHTPWAWFTSQFWPQVSTSLPVSWLNSVMLAEFNRVPGLLELSEPSVMGALMRWPHKRCDVIQ